ncbi:MAG: prepilin-type N-terminal cleavage/methylation domain-containing protein [Planctomycetia bacterium]|nr:prepilin-type N-terminal cleavage/methylation domain-containing protein [Planctomycetia bacterium]
MRNEQKTKRAGFTLVELLVVIMIIALLSGISVVVFRGAKNSVEASVAAAEIQQLSMALDAYKAKYGEYPPDFSDGQAVMRHVKKRWPRSTWGTSETDFVNFCTEISNCGVTGFGGYSGSESAYYRCNAKYVSALVFWLGGLPNAEGRPAGFYLNPKDPLTATATGQREEPMYDFDPDKIHTNSDGIVAYCPRGILPLLYFKATDLEYGANCVGRYADPANLAKVKCRDMTGDSLGYAVPYAKGTAAGTWYEQDRFQIVHPGVDGIFGDTDNSIIRNAQTQKNLKPTDMDNVTNFLSKGSILEAEAD